MLMLDFYQEIITMRFSPIVLLLSVMLGCGSESQSVNEAVESRKQAIATIKKLGGTVVFDQKSPNRPVIKVDFSRTQLTDNGLEHLKGLTNLNQLWLGNTDITGPGLVHLKGLTKLEMLILDDTDLTSTGLEHLNGLTNLHTLTLGNTKVTDDGLKHLKGLINLQLLTLVIFPHGRYHFSC
jgi:hypothetical protein